MWFIVFEKDLHIGLLLDFYGDMLSSRQKDIMNQYYNDDLSLGEIAENAGISRQGVRSAVKKSEQLLNEYESRLGLAERFRAMTNAAEQTAKELENAETLEEAKALASKIRELAAL
jgi:predicted DNA-binding protein YlxM (UPF0122 family)